MSSKSYVGSLPFSTDGTVQSARVITGKFTGQSRGFGFVEITTSNESSVAISALHGTELGGRTLTLNEAKPQAPRSGSSSFGDDRGVRETNEGRW